MSRGTSRNATMRGDEQTDYVPHDITLFVCRDWCDSQGSGNEDNEGWHYYGLLHYCLSLPLRLNHR